MRPEGPGRPFLLCVFNLSPVLGRGYRAASRDQALADLVLPVVENERSKAQDGPQKGKPCSLFLIKILAILFIRLS